MRRNAFVMVLFGTLVACTSSTTNTAPQLGGVTLTPASANFGCPPATATFTASQSGFTGTFTAASADTANETVAAGPGANQFTVTRSGATTSTPVNITVTGGGGQTAVFTANNIGCICMRHHDMWNAHMKTKHHSIKRRRHS